ncbi:MAG: hypothetical protein ACYC4L_08825 [Chloroflexota bacterium]
MDVMDLVGRPDWRSALLAALFALPWLAWLGRGWLRSRWLWLALAAGAALFSVSIAWVQVPLDQAMDGVLLGLFDKATIERNLLVLSIPSLLIASAVQETTKVLVAILALRAARAAGDRRAGLAFGAAAGAGYGGFEAFWAMNTVFAAGLTLGTVQLAGPMALMAFVERFFAVPFHIGSAAVAAYGYASGRPWRFWLLAVLLHTVVNYGVILLMVGALNAVTVEVWVAVFALVTVGFALWLRRRTAPTLAHRPTTLG